MKITIEGLEYEFVPLANPNGTYEFAGLKPVKKTEDKEEYKLQIWPLESAEDIYSEILDLTPTTANKLSEAISALVEYVQDDTIENHERLMTFAWEARKSFQESQ